DINNALKVGARGVTPHTHTGRWRDYLVVIEMGLSFALMIGAALMIRSVWQLHRVELGFDPTNVLTMQFTIPPFKFNSDGKQTLASITTQKRAFIERVVERVKLLPGVVNAAAASSIPWRRDGHIASNIVGKPGQYSCRWRVASSDYFRTMGMPLLKGRAFTDQDTPQSGKVVIVNAEFVRKYFPEEEPLGTRLGTLGSAQAEIIGVVADVRHNRFDQPMEPAYYAPLSQEMSGVTYLVIRTNGDPLRHAGAVKSAVWAEDKNQPLEEIATLEEIKATTTSDSRFISSTLTVFASIALLLSTIGMYGVISYLVAQRKHEIGVRMALGAKQVDVAWLVLAKGMKLTLLAVAISMTVTLWLTRLLKSLLFGVSATDPPTFVAIAVLMMFVTIIACWIPVRRAAQVDPMIAIRYE
ncbi:MAG: FtsX-like permease family protein, partial [Acidobacteriota bacterium]